ncbi:uncharacterized protein DC041_0004825 [Schistosoma bovis]|uniref:Uncharacterized protein n=1 Tax=Schistosoma bovis TaxID=6184 RepID=A0A430Q0G8_SCHBO|nr:uncharacterized protein DC041_0004825 [Schistosoma bovis]
MSLDVGLFSVLEKSLSLEKSELEAAQHFLEEAAKVDLFGLLRQLSMFWLTLSVLLLYVCKLAFS